MRWTQTRTLADGVRHELHRAGVLRARIVPDGDRWTVTMLPTEIDPKGLTETVRAPSFNALRKLVEETIRRVDRLC